MHSRGHSAALNFFMPLCISHACRSYCDFFRRGGGRSKVFLFLAMEIQAVRSTHDGAVFAEQYGCCEGNQPRNGVVVCNKKKPLNMPCKTWNTKNNGEPPTVHIYYSCRAK